MTHTPETTRHTPWTPFDADLEAIIYGSNGPTLAQTEQLRDLHNLRDGYLEKAEEDAPLLEAAKEAWDCFHELFPGGDVEEFIVEQTGNPSWIGLMARLGAAIASISTGRSSL